MCGKLILTATMLALVVVGRARGADEPARAPVPDPIQPPRQADAAEDAPQINLRLLIAEEREGVRHVLSRPTVRTLSGQPATIEVGQHPAGKSLRIELMATVQPERATNPLEPVRKGSPLADPLVHVRLQVSDVEEGKSTPRAKLQLRTPIGEPASIRAAGLEIALTPQVVDPAAQTASRPAPPTEDRIARLLQKRISVQFDEVTLAEAFKELATRTGLSFHLDPGALADEGHTPQSTVTLNTSGTRLCTLLDRLLEPLRLDYLVADEVIQITSRQRARGELVALNYPVGDLLHTGSPAEEKSGLDASRPRAISPQELIERITRTIDPASWDEVGGPASVRQFQSNNSLVIRQSRDAHEEIARLLEILRRGSETAVHQD